MVQRVIQLTYFLNHRVAAVLLTLMLVGGAGCASESPVTGADFSASDDDRDGVADRWDQCPLTRPGLAVNQRGCALDGDQDRVPNELDRCPDSLPGSWVDSRGCDQDRDRDKVPDSDDACRQTPAGSVVDARGCSLPRPTGVEAKG